MNKALLALYGLKFNPFVADIPDEALWHPPGMDSYLLRIENLIADGGFALICGEPGLGKSKALQLVALRLKRLDDIIVGVMERPQSSLNDFYREMGALFGVNLSPSNRYGGFKALRRRWQSHVKTTLFRPVLLVDEAQEMDTDCLNELRLLQSAHFDSRSLLSTVMCGDMRLPHRFGAAELVSLGSRMRLRLILQPYERNVLLGYLEHALKQSGAPHLMTRSLKQTLAEHASGNLRLLNTMAADVLSYGAQKEAAQLDEKLFIELFSHNR